MGSIKYVEADAEELGKALNRVQQYLLIMPRTIRVGLVLQAEWGDNVD